ncbi:hypothetical protein ABH931_002654 [Streptacidiphilus sp. MAP12-33]|uniref:hypothetical protein n=1 Tax=Streptacidiphilus sp. MAP12-33 TaxID=3156266 RepID=UPI0035141082
MKRQQEQSTAAVPNTPLEFDTAIAAAYQALLSASNAGDATRGTKAAQPAPAPVRSPADEPAAKRPKGEGGAAVTPPKLTREPSNLVPRRHVLPRMARVTLRPLLELDPQGRIQRLVISPGHRTPSPFGSRMGDHTVAWQAVVDALRAALFGADLDTAVQVLTNHQAQASAWMSQSGSTGKKRLALLPDAARRTELLEDSAFEVAEQLKAATTALTWGSPPAAAAALERAIAFHLTYVNYLPFSTVPVYSAGGSKGSGEGSYRRLLLETEAPGAGIDRGAEVDDFAADEEPDETLEEASAATQPLDVAPEGAEAESEAPPQETEPAPTAPVDRPALLRNALWKLFSFEAALRASRVSAALQPPQPAGENVVSGEHKDLERLVVAVLDQLDLSPKVRKVLATQGRTFVPGTAYDPALVTKLQAEGERMRTSLFGDPEKTHLSQLASSARDAAAAMKSAEISGGLAPGKAEQYRKALAVYRTPAQVATAKIVNAAEHALPNAALVLAYLLHDHQMTVVAAYPQSVSVSGFLTPLKPLDSGTTDPATAPAAAALEQLHAEITARATRLRADGQALEKLLTATKQAYAELFAASPVPRPVLNGWAAHRATEALVVAYNATPGAGEPVLEVNGRAPAPRGVAGMGSHTTAWLVEVAATDAMAAVPNGALQGFRDAVVKDLRSDVMRLDCVLPVDQLRGGQIRLVFDTAARVLDATSIREAAAQYLRFRNLLPYATVDAGDRGGHGEDLTRPSNVLFDLASLRHAAELHDATLTGDDDRNAVARDLATLATSLSNKPSASWGKHQEIREAVAACSLRLAAQSTLLMAGRPEKTVETILGVRWREHEDTFRRAQVSRMVANARKAKGLV